MSSVDEFDSVVVGGGIMGYCTALSLAQQGRRTALLEQFPSPHTRGSSTGQTRVTRIANYGIEAITPIMVDALQRWKDIEKQTGKQIFVPSPMLCVGQGIAIEKQRQSLLSGGITPVDYTIDEINAMYGTNFGKNEKSFMDPEAGVLLADKCILLLKDMFERAGGFIKDTCKVIAIAPEPVGKSSTIITKSGTIKANRIAICCGPWSGKLLQNMGVKLPLKPIKVGVFYWKLKCEGNSTPIFIRTDGKDEQLHFYGLPDIEYPGMVKICPHDGVPCDPDARDATDASSLLSITKEFVQQYFPCLEPEPVIVENCMYTMTPDAEMILDHLPSNPNIVYACGFSGTGFKLGPTVGRLLSQLATGAKPDIDVTAFSASRFPKSKY